MHPRHHPVIQGLNLVAMPFQRLRIAVAKPGQHSSRIVRGGLDLHQKLLVKTVGRLQVIIEAGNLGPVAVLVDRQAGQLAQG